MRFKKYRTAIIISVIYTLISCNSGQEGIEGILYSDNKPVSVTIRDGKIASVRKISKLSDEDGGLFVAPGLIDNQVNGYAGVSFTFGGGELTVEGVKKATRELWETGVTTYLPTLTTNSNELLTKNFSILAQAIDDPEIMGSIAGFHLEGPYISPVDGYRGAHPLRFVRKPDWEEFTQLQKASGNRIIQVSLAPETEGALDFIKKCKESSVLVGLAHHNAPALVVKEAIDLGAIIATHLGNGCANMINRHINPLWPQLSDDRLMISVIGDGFHLNPEEIRTFYKVKGPGKTIITSDVTSYASLPPGKFINVEGDTIELTPDGMIRYPAQNVLAGSASPIKKGVMNVMNVTGCTLEEAIRMASLNPAKLYNLNDRGVIEVGKKADMILFRITGNEMVIERTYVNGKLVYEKE